MDLVAAVQQGVISRQVALDSIGADVDDGIYVSTCARPRIYVQNGVTFGGRAKCEHCGHWGQRFFECAHCGAPID